MLEVVAENIERAEELSIKKGELLLKDLLLYRRGELKRARLFCTRKFTVKLSSEFNFMVELLYAVSVAFFVSIIDYKLLNLLILTPL